MRYTQEAVVYIHDKEIEGYLVYAKITLQRVEEGGPIWTRDGEVTKVYLPADSEGSRYFNVTEILHPKTFERILNGACSLANRRADKGEVTWSPPEEAD